MWYLCKNFIIKYIFIINPISFRLLDFNHEFLMLKTNHTIWNIFFEKIYRFKSLTQSKGYQSIAVFIIVMTISLRITSCCGFRNPVNTVNWITYTDFVDEKKSRAHQYSFGVFQNVKKNYNHQFVHSTKRRHQKFHGQFTFSIHV